MANEAALSGAAQPDPRDGMTAIPEYSEVDERRFREEVVRARRPVVLRGQVADWPLVGASREGDASAAAYLRNRDPGAQVETFVGAPDMGGRFFYNDEVTGFNFRKVRAPFKAVLDMLAGQAAGNAPPMYMGSTPVQDIVPDFALEHPLALLAAKAVQPRIWIGNRSKVAPHFDETDNVACVVSGRRRFTVFPPEQVANLYVGPLDFTMAGQPASMVDLGNPDYVRYPRIREALRHAMTAELGPGDAIYIPALWWHHVEAAADFNILVNYWWQDSPADAGSPFACLAHGVMTISHLPPETRMAWRSFFDHLVFQADGDPAAHLPPGSRGILEPSTPQSRSRIRQFLLRVLGGR